MKNGERMKCLLIEEVNEMNYDELTDFLTAISGVEQLKKDILTITHKRFEEECISNSSKIDEYLDNGLYFKLLEKWYDQEELRKK